MIIGMIFRNYKCYNGINYTPISNGSNFNAFIGENGVGKSSILEALEVFFNGGPWNINSEALNGGLSTRMPFICPVFLLSKRKWDAYAKNAKDKECIEYIAAISSILWDVKVEEFNAAQRNDAESFINHREQIRRKIDQKRYYLVPVGIEYEETEKKYISIFQSLPLIEELLSRKDKDRYLKVGSKEEIAKTLAMRGALSQIGKFITSKYNYIYIPAEVDVEKYTKLESKTIQKLSGKDIESKLREIISKDTLRSINTQLAQFISEVERTLEEYQYRKPSIRQANLNFSDISSKVIEAYFSIRVLNKKNDAGFRTPISQLSSGEKRKALVDIAHAFLSNSKELEQEVIFAMDEPEASLHTGAIFDQFEKIHRAVTGAECNTVIELKLEHHAA